MIPFLLGWAIVAYAAFWAFRKYQLLKLHISEAEKSGIPYVIAPAYFFNRLWLITSPVLIPIIQKSLPTSWTKQWIKLAHPMWLWKNIREPFDEAGSDTFLVVSPGRTQLFTCDADVISQITNRRVDFPKPLEMYKALDVYGPNLVSSEGMLWRHHRRMTAPPFNDRNNRLVWIDTIHQAKCMIHYWETEGHDEKGTIQTLHVDTMKVALHVISRAGFGVPLLWPHEEQNAKERGEAGINSSYVPAGHDMSFRDALATLLQNLIPIIILPKWFLRIAPFKQLNLALKAYYEWGAYMHSMIDDKKQDIREGKPLEGFDILGTYLRSAGESSEFEEATPAEKASLEKRLISDEEVLGNMFVMLLAGHETTSNTIHYSILFLAIHRESQRRLQRDLDSIFQGRDPSEWDYDTDAPKLYGGMVGAIMQEQLRLIPPVTGIPKSTPKGSPQAISVNGRKCIIPENTAISLDTVSTHRNPKYWANSTPDVDPMSDEYDLNQFKPERWLLSEQHGENKKKNAGEKAEFMGVDDADTSSDHIKPPKGAFLPFSDGPRSCIGRRFAQVEALAVLAVLFQKYSIELAVDDFASDEEVARMTKDEKAATYKKATDRVEYYWKEKMFTAITIQFRGVHVPIRLVKRGEERFADI